MPYKWTDKHIKLGEFDRRRSGLSDDDKENIKRRHKQGEAIRSIARTYAKLCSRRLIIFILYPERLKVMQDKHRAEQHWKKYGNREKLTKATKNWRNYKQNLITNNKIT